MRSSARRTYPSRRCHRHDCGGTSSSLGTASAFPWPCTSRRWFARPEAMLISRISRRISSSTVGRPPRRPDFQRQYNRNPARCQRTTVPGFTIANASQTLGNNRYRPTNTNRSMTPKESFSGAVRRKTFICCRNVRISASSATRDRNRSTTIQPISLHKSLITQQHRPILGLSPAR